MLRQDEVQHLSAIREHHGRSSARCEGTRPWIVARRPGIVSLGAFALVTFLVIAIVTVGHVVVGVGGVAYGAPVGRLTTTLGCVVRNEDRDMGVFLMAP